MPDTWTTTTVTSGVWDQIPPTAYLLLTEDGQTMRTEASGALLVEYETETWTNQSDSATTWTTV